MLYSCCLSPCAPASCRFQEDPSAEALWRQVCSLGPDQALPGQWPDHFYFSLAAKMQACRLDTCVGAWLDSFPREQVMAIGG